MLLFSLFYYPVDPGLCPGESFSGHSVFNCVSTAVVTCFIKKYHELSIHTFEKKPREIWKKKELREKKQEIRKFRLQLRRTAFITVSVFFFNVCYKNGNNKKIWPVCPAMVPQSVRTCGVWQVMLFSLISSCDN